MYEFEHGDVLYYIEDHLDDRVWVGVVCKPFGDYQKSVAWWSPSQQTLMTPQNLPSLGKLYLVGNIDEDWVEWDVE